MRAAQAQTETMAQELLVLVAAPLDSTLLVVQT
jgi:hypothetical protein